jgi:predicted RNA-binding protein YlxR (DUF448 family)
VGCGRLACKRELVRLAVSHPVGGKGLIVIDEDGRMPGRGAYLCASQSRAPKASCLASALRRGGPQRTLRARASIDPKLVESVSP